MVKKNNTRSLSALIFILTFILIFLLSVRFTGIFNNFTGLASKSTSLNDAPRQTIYVDPESSNAAVGTTFDVYIKVRNVGGSGLFSYGFELYFKDSQDNSKKCPILKPVSEETIKLNDYFLKPTINPANIFVVDPGTICCENARKQGKKMTKTVMELHAKEMIAPRFVVEIKSQKIQMIVAYTMSPLLQHYWIVKRERLVEEHWLK